MSWRGSDWVAHPCEDEQPSFRAICVSALLVAGLALGALALMAGCAQMQEHADKARAFWCDPSTGRVPTYAKLVRAIKPEASPQVRQAVAAAEAACASPELPLDVLVATGVLAGLSVRDVE